MLTSLSSFPSAQRHQTKLKLRVWRLEAAAGPRLVARNHCACVRRRPATRPAVGPSELPPYFRAVALAPAAGELRRKVADGRRVYPPASPGPPPRVRTSRLEQVRRCHEVERRARRRRGRARRRAPASAPKSAGEPSLVADLRGRVPPANRLCETRGDYVFVRGDFWRRGSRCRGRAAAARARRRLFPPPGARRADRSSSCVEAPGAPAWRENFSDEQVRRGARTRHRFARRRVVHVARARDSCATAAGHGRTGRALREERPVVAHAETERACRELPDHAPHATGRGHRVASSPMLLQNASVFSRALYCRSARRRTLEARDLRVDGGRRGHQACARASAAAAAAAAGGGRRRPACRGASQRSPRRRPVRATRVDVGPDVDEDCARAPAATTNLAKQRLQASPETRRQ